VVDQYTHCTLVILHHGQVDKHTDRVALCNCLACEYATRLKEHFTVRYANRVSNKSPHSRVICVEPEKKPLVIFKAEITAKHY